ncbi:echinoderm microtubule-associated protein-like 3 [Protopterus annectens]|uniref:echinoderm microtubule-associated protein-like 3 n=1 Tax=Protopterus annectens TaxID=7888 RepID=UPI001CFA82A7|nr:echinoderm microtubule-associated protein-like 3 [Protopterus annectens]
MDGLGNSLDDSASAGSSPECPDRLSLLEMRIQAQEEEMTLVKSALNDALRRISFYDEQIPLLKQKLLTGSSSILEAFSNRGVLDNTSTTRKLSSSSMQDCCKPETSPTSSCAAVNEVKNRMNNISKQQSLINHQGTRGLQPSFSPTDTYAAEKVTVATQTEGFSASLMQPSESIPLSCSGVFHDHTMNGQLNYVDRVEEQCLFTETVICQSQVQAYEAVNSSKEDSHTDDSHFSNPAHFNELQNPPEAQIHTKAGLLIEETYEDNSKFTKENTVKESLISAVQATQRPKENTNSQTQEQTEPHSSSETTQQEKKTENQAVSPTSQSDLQSPQTPTGSVFSMQTNEYGVAVQKENGCVLQAVEKEKQSSLPAHSTVQSREPLSPISAVQALIANKKTLVRRSSTSDKLIKSATEKSKQKLSQKAASSASLLMRSPSLENRMKDLASGTKRGSYNQDRPYVKMFLRGRPITMYVPSNIQTYEDLKMELPAEKLKIDWVYGYRGRDCRSNMYMLASGEVVYFIACIVVLYHIEEKTQRHYLKHTDCVRCLAVHPDKVRVATGQTAGVDKDGKPLQPFINIWDSNTLNTLLQIGMGSFERGVGSVAFSWADHGAYLCAIDETNEHMLSIWDCAKGSKQAEIKSTNEAVFVVEFNPADSSNFITCGKSHVYFWTWSGNSLTKKQGIFGKFKKPKFIHCVVFVNGDVLTGDSEGNIFTWGKTAADTKTLGKGAKETYQIVKQTKAHEGSIFTMCLLRNGSLISGGGKDRKIIQWSKNLALEKELEIPEQFGAVRTIAEGNGEEFLIGTTRNAILRGSFSAGFTPIMQGHIDELWGLATHPSENIFMTCAHDKQVCMWDATDHTLMWSTTLEEVGLCADFHPSGAVVAVGLNTGRWVVLDTETKEVVYDYIDGNEQLSVVRYSPDGSFLAIGSHDNFIYIYSVVENGKKYNRFGRCTGHSSFITHLDWSKDGNFIMSNSGDYEILYWDVAAGCKLLRNRSDSRDREWATYTCVLGFHVLGVWPDGSDGTDINSLCRSHHERVVAVADDFCKVHLLQYPCAKPKAPSHMYGGHGSHVTNVRFTFKDSHLISLGGKDTCIIQWQTLSSALARSQSVSSASVSSVEAGSCA